MYCISSIYLEIC